MVFDEVPETERQDILKILYFAEEGNVAAQRELGFRYSKGNGVPLDDEKAAAWFRRAARAGDVEAQFQLGLCFLHGSGVKQNEERAKKCFRRAALKGHSEAASLLKSRYRAIGAWTSVLAALFCAALGIFVLRNVIGGVLVGILGGYVMYAVLEPRRSSIDR